MSELKKKPSGAAYKRKAKEKEEKHQNVILIKHTKNIETFFSKSKSDDSESSNAIHSASATYPIQCNRKFLLVLNNQKICPCPHRLLRQQ
jgi:hypothetical protein